MVDRMREFKSLHPERLPRAYDIKIHGEKPIVTIKEAEKRITIEYTFPGFYLSDDARHIEGEELQFKQVNIAHTGLLVESGKPLLPSFGRYVQIPPNCEYTISIEKSEPAQFDDILIVPAQEKLTDTEEETTFEYDRQFYGTDKYYPENVVEVSGPFEIDGYTCLLVHVRPLQYNPSKKKVQGFSSITVTLDMAPKELFTALAEPGLDKEVYGNLFLNPERRAEERVFPGTDTVIPFSTEPGGPEFLIVYDDTFKEAAERLQKWKTMRGLHTEIVSTEKTGRTIEAIKSYIRNKRESNSSRLRYVLLFGDVEMIPLDRIKGSIYKDINSTDYYYSTKRDPNSTKEYLFPWLSVGRIPVKTAKEGLAVVNQIIAYEKDPPDDSKYYSRMVFAASFEDKKPRDGKDDKKYVKTMEEIREHMVTLGFDVERVYVTNNPNIKEYNDGTTIPEAVKKAIVDTDTASKMLTSATSKGCLIIGHRDHGGKNGWSHPPFKKIHLGDVTGDTPTMFYSINCLTGRFDKKGADSFAEKLLKMKGGAPSLLAATRKSFPGLNDPLIKAVFDAMWAGVIPTFGSAASYSVKYNRLGDILNYGKAYLPLVLDNPRFIKDHFEIFHVIGDPTLEVWEAKPLEARVQVKREQGRLHIRTDCPRGSIITVWHKDRILERKEYPHRVTIPLGGVQSSEEISVYFWAPGYRFKEVVL
ncbi:MAG: C25 family cysteine peptidase [Candidatus Methanofastidiosia archaeon]